MPLSIHLLSSPAWKDYELLDSGNGLKLERFGPYTFIRPEVQALWSPHLPPARWEAAHGVFQPTGEESGGHWNLRKKIAERWEMQYPLEKTSHKFLKFTAMTTPGRHLGVFPECAANWDWMVEEIIRGRSKKEEERKEKEREEKERKEEERKEKEREEKERKKEEERKEKEREEKERKEEERKKEEGVRVLNLFGYTGLATLAAAAAGAQVTHVDASKKSVTWARENAALSGLAEHPIRWIVDDALKFVQREGRRGVKYDGIVLDPPKFGRGPKGEVWEIYQSLPALLNACRAILSESPLFIILTVYAVKLSALHIGQALQEMMNGLGGSVDCGELVTIEKSAGRLLSQAVYARWTSQQATKENG